MRQRPIYLHNNLHNKQQNSNLLSTSFSKQIPLGDICQLM
ncbi:hypothetical protein GCHA_2699 [Paraglaciecola chathamensis S18K6]|uniref:Uncharacterized protein n=1 Tax=Paraglaciecola chathamensis S18K6 TaxID=1127672 RepID=A0AAV3V0U5_9ALTE|nr:hypothetical protein GCHA_2699 [Paraglaciecola chathamensis S18K6]